METGIVVRLTLNSIFLIGHEAPIVYAVDALSHTGGVHNPYFRTDL